MLKWQECIRFPIFYLSLHILLPKNEGMDIQMSYIIAPLLGGAVKTFDSCK